jgi:uncharacterized protein YbjT (DUF2867 family)
MNKKITVIGATGMIGIPVTNELIRAGFEVTALVRNVEKAKQTFPAGVNFVKGDIQNTNDISKSLINADAVYINISTTANDKQNEFNPEIGGLDNILLTLKTSTVKQVVFLSSLLARNYTGNWWVMKAKKQGITKIKNCGIPYTIFYPSNFMENFKGGMKDGKKINTIGTSTEKAWWVAGEDFGRQVANALKTEKSLNKEYPVQGLEALTITEASKIYADNYSTEKLSVANLPMGMAKFLALFVKPLKFVVPLMQVMNSNKEKFEAQKTWDELGKPAITLNQFARK